MLMKTLFVSLRWDYKDPARGPSFEFTNFWDALRRMEGVEAEHFPFDEVEARSGRHQMNRELELTVQRMEPDLVFFFLFEDEFDPELVGRIGRRTSTLNWFADDHWRFQNYSRRWASRFTWVATTDIEAVAKYEDLGCNVLLTQWGCNHHLYRPLHLPLDLPVTFVGQPHGSRGRVISRLRDSGIDVRTWGFGWPEGRLDESEMIAVFNRSRVNLNLSNASPARSPLRTVRDLVKVAVRSGGRLDDVVAALRGMGDRGREQLKGRNFQIPGCGAFLLTNEHPELARYYEPGKEIISFTDIDDLIDKTRHFLSRPAERTAIAAAGLSRTLAEHTYELRFSDLFRKMGLV